jgi:hypothetical protein
MASRTALPVALPLVAIRADILANPTASWLDGAPRTKGLRA